MVKVALSNRNSHLEPTRVVVDIAQGTCALNNGQTITMAQLYQLKDFSHPLLQEPTKLHESNHSRFQYTTIDSMLYAAKYVYATLLRADNPQELTFTIEPAASYKPYFPSNEIYISAQSAQEAEEKITIEQLNQLTQRFGVSSFKFCESLIINEEITMQTLPETVDGDKLYEMDNTVYQLLGTPPGYDNYELRYIDPGMGFGVFARTGIKKDTVIGIYTGLMSQHMNQASAYIFIQEEDSLNMYTDSVSFGNITRFVNHAESGDEACNPGKPKALMANLTAYHSSIYGLGVVLYKANRDIAPGEQLLVNYGECYFVAYAARHFNRQGKLRDVKKLRHFLPKYSQDKLYKMRLLAQWGIKGAHHYVWSRLLVIISMLALLTGLIHYKC